MKFKYPGHDLAFYTAIPAIIFLVYFPYLIITGTPFEWYMWVLIPYGLSGILIWFQVRAAGIVFICFNALGLFASVVALLTGQVTLRILLKGLMNFCSITAAYEWLKQLDKNPQRDLELE